MIDTEADRMKQCLSELDRSERYVVLMHFADDLTPVEIGLVLSLSTHRVETVLNTFRERAAVLLAASQRPATAPAHVNNWLCSAGSAVV